MAKTLTIFQVEEIKPTRRGERPEYHRSAGQARVVASEKSIDELQEHMTDFIEGVQAILAKGAQVAGQFHMETVEVQAQIGLEGKIGFLGTGAAAKGSSQIKIVFARNKES